MRSGTIPRPIAYALSIVIVALGFSVSYQVLIGSSFSYESKLGSIQLGQGDNATTLAEFVDQSQEALAAAKDSIATLEAENEDLRAQIEKYQQTMQEIQQTASATSGEEALKDTVSNLSALVPSERMPAKNYESLREHRVLLERQLVHTNQVQKMLESKDKAP